jgi:tetratricopeptide (TPR) repeat protein
MAWAEALWQDGGYERALDLYHAVPQRDVRQALADAYLSWGDALQGEGDYRAAIATYRRSKFDVVNARLWDEADKRTQSAYCAWAGMLREAGDLEQAAAICAELLDAFSDEVVGACSACAPE